MKKYIGRFAPSPTGKLHAGSLACALASYVDARAHDGIWLIRVEDIDPPREPSWAARHQLDTLASFGMVSDLPVLYQSTRTQAYAEALETLKCKGLVFGCNCSRKSISEACEALGLPPNVYPGTCRNKNLTQSVRAWRFRVSDDPVEFNDRLFGRQVQNLEREVGDFVLKRADGFWAYQLAVTVDDAHQGVTHIVRGEDLLDNTPRQIAIQRAMGVATPSYLHIPLVRNELGQKLSKQSGALELDAENLDEELLRAWRHLGFEAPRFDSLDSFYNQAIDSWRKSWYFAG